MTYQVVSQNKIEDTKQGPRFQITVKTDTGTYQTTYVFHDETNDSPVQFLIIENTILETGAKMTPEEIMRETWRYLRDEGYDTSRPFM